MSLPKINTPEYRLTIPSTDEEIKFRPFLVQEEKLLLIAQQTGDSLHINPETGRITNNPNAEKLWKREYQKGWEPKV